MDTESQQELNDLVVRWRTKAEQWQQQQGTLLHHSEGLSLLEADIEKLVRHMEGLHGIQNTLGELTQIRSTLVELLDQHRASAVAGALASPHDQELLAIEEAMRKLHCHPEAFLVKYMMVKDDYRAPGERLPLPNGFRCHKQYAMELELLKTRIHNALKQAETYRQQLLRANSTGEEPNAVWTAEEARIIAEINHCMNTHNNLKASLYHLLMHVEPIDAAAFHAQCNQLIERRLSCLEAKRLAQIQCFNTTAAATAALNNKGDCP
jgi:hypothetical protein